MLFTSFQMIIAQTPTESRSWKKVALESPALWYATSEAKEVANHVLTYQSEEGGWPKNIRMQDSIPAEVLSEIRRGITTKSHYTPTIDNEATTTEMMFLAKMYQATQDKRYRNAFYRGLNYLEAAQYPNGGWPQFYPLKKGYYSHITYNDNAIVNVMKLLKSIVDRDSMYLFVSSKSILAKVQRVYDAGLSNILQTQIYRHGQPTVWCAQHHEITLEPVSARAFELESFSGRESAEIVYFLMSIQNPSPQIIKAIQGAVVWFKEHQIEGYRLETVTDEKGISYKTLIPDAAAKPIWARFYDLETEKPFFVGRDGVKKFTVEEIDEERQKGYAWYCTEPQKVLKRYPSWEKKIAH